MWEALGRKISDCTGEPFRVVGHQPLEGGCINQAVLLQGEGAQYFVKLNGAPKLSMFEAEMAGLEEILKSCAIRVPKPICCGIESSQAYLVLEYIELSTSGDGALMGEQLAMMHRYTGQYYGWDRDNTIGSTHQKNMPCDDWVTFYRDQRLGYQFELAQMNGLSVSGKEALLAGLASFFEGVRACAIFSAWRFVGW